MISNRVKRYCLIYLFVFVWNLGDVAANELVDLRRPAFTDPLDVIEPSNSSWISQPIQYPPKYQGADIFLTLDQQLYPALLPLIREYAKANQLIIKVLEGTCGISAGMLGRKEADIGGYCCPPGKTDRFPGLRFHTLGISSIAVFVHPDNQAIETLTLSQLKQIFSGETQRWSDIKPTTGNQLIHPVGRLHCKLRPGHWRLILENEELFSTELNEVSSIPDMISMVSADKNAIGYETLWMVKRYETQGKVKSVNIEQKAPTDSEALLKGEYPLYRTFNIASWEKSPVKNGYVDGLVGYLLSNVERVSDDFALIPFNQLKTYGWQFYKDELIGEPIK